MDVEGAKWSGLLIKFIQTVIWRGVGVYVWHTSATSCRQRANDRCLVVAVALDRLYCDAANVQLVSQNANMMFNPFAGLPDNRKPMYSQPQHSVYKSGDKTSPISVILVSSGSRGNRLLFRYPFQRVAECPSSLAGRRSIMLAFIHQRITVQQLLLASVALYQTIPSWSQFRIITRMQSKQHFPVKCSPIL